MSWSFRFGKLFGIDVFVHFTFVLLLGFIGLSHWMQTRDLAVALAGVGFFIACFVWIGAQQEAGLVQMKSALANTPMRAVMITEFRTLAPDDTLARAVEYILAGFQQDFPVVEGQGRLVGVLTRADLIRALSEAGKTALVGEQMQREFHTAGPSDMAEGILARLHECNCHSLPVVQNGPLVGLLTAENLGEFLMIQTALQGGKAAPARPA